MRTAQGFGSRLMPSTSKKQRRLMRAAMHGADFPMAKKVRQSMAPATLAEFAEAPVSKKKPTKKKPKPKPARDVESYSAY